MLYSPAFSFSSVYPLGFLPCAGLRLGSGASFKLFWPPALAGRAPLAIILQAPRRFRGAVLFRSSRTSSSWGFPFWLLGLTLRSSGPAFCGPLTLAVKRSGRSAMQKPKPKRAVPLVQHARGAMGSVAQRVRQVVGTASVSHPVPHRHKLLRLTLHSSRPPTAASEFGR